MEQHLFHIDIRPFQSAYLSKPQSRGQTKNNSSCHYFEQKSDTGLQMEFLQKYLLIPLDIYRKNQHNKGIGSKRDAWLALFSCDEPEVVVEPCEKYPEFRKMYEEGYEICRDTERVMEMFSKELYELDRNTVQYMIDEMQDTIDAQKEEIGKQQGTIDFQKEELEKRNAELKNKTQSFEKKRQS